MEPSRKVIIRTVAVIIFAVVTILVISLISSSLQKLASDEVGLYYDTINKVMGDEAKLEGLHFGPPGYSFIVFPSVFESFEHERLMCLNNDGVQIRLSVSYQFRVRPYNLKDIIKQFKDYDGFKDVLRAIGESAIHDACSVFNTSLSEAERGVFSEELRRRLVKKYDDVDCDVTDLQVREILRPGPYEQSVRDKESAREDIEVAKKERPRLLTLTKTKKREDEIKADITIDKAHSDARIVQNKAAADAEAILNEYQEEAKTYKSLMATNGLDTKAFLTFMAIRAIESQDGDVYVGMQSPAQTNWLN